MTRPRISISDFAQEPYARIMAWGFFGGFIFGFLGTAMPRMLSAKPLSKLETGLLTLLYTAMVGSFAFGKIVRGDRLFLILLVSFAVCMARRAAARKDNPPPGFILVAMAFLCAAAGTIAGLLLQQSEPDALWTTLQKLLSYQGFILLPILGIGPFILPRFFGMQSAHDLPESRKPSSEWSKKALLALAAGLSVIISFVLEAKGWTRTAHGLRFVAASIYLVMEMPFRLGPERTNIFGFSVRVALVALLLGFLTIAIFPAYRVSLLHLTLIGGFSVITLTVATRVIFGHSGNLDRLKGRNRWMLVALGLMLFGMATRISGDFWPRILVSHYIYGAISWIAGVIIWSIYVLPRVFVIDSES